MKLIRNSGTDRVLDALNAALAPGCSLDVATPELSLFAFAQLRAALGSVPCRLVVPDPTVHDLALLGSAADRGERNKLLARWLAAICVRWVPEWFKVPTPLGNYEPDWAVLIEKDGAERLYFVAETKGSLHAIDLREKERAKKECGGKHFAALAEDEANPAKFVTATSLADVLAHTV